MFLFFIVFFKRHTLKHFLERDVILTRSRVYFKHALILYDTKLLIQPLIFQNGGRLVNKYRVAPLHPSSENTR